MRRGLRYDDVVNVTYRRVLMNRTHNGPMVKGRSQGNATVRDVLFEDVRLLVRAGTRYPLSVPAALVGTLFICWLLLYIYYYIHVGGLPGIDDRLRLRDEWERGPEYWCARDQCDVSQYQRHGHPPTPARGQRGRREPGGGEEQGGGRGA